MKEEIKEAIQASIATKQKLLESQAGLIEQAAKEIIGAYSKGKKLLICGNGGSAADSQHFAAEMTGRYKLERRALPAIALHTDTSAMTAIGNDYSFDRAFSRQVEAHGEAGDILFAISTSGNSKNVVEAAFDARKKKMRVICLLGGEGGKLKSLGDVSIVVPSKDTARIQESHILTIHIICDLVEKALFGSGN